VDSVGNIFVTGYSDLSFGGPREYATVGYSSLGLPLWTNCYLGPASSVDVPSGVAVDSNGNVFVTGASKSTNGYFEYATIKYSGIGMPLWTNRYHGSGNAGDSANAIAVDQDGNVFVTGSSSAGTPDYATIAYSSAGAPLWTNLYDGPGGDPAGSADIATAMAVDGSGNIFVTGYSYSPNGYYYPYATIKYSSSLRPLLSFQALNRQGILRWSNSAFTLQSAPSLTGTFTNIPGATSPYTNPVAGAQQYFRLVAP
jgi:hypothetical protein